eukprot:8583300-Alexandrium_andersonii.AAC.1
MSASLVGSEMCIRDSAMADSGKGPEETPLAGTCTRLRRTSRSSEAVPGACLLYTSDAADDM